MVTRKELKQSIIDKIESGEWPPGFQLPSTQRLVEEYDCSESTVYNAMLELAAAKLVWAHKGGARYVAGGETEMADSSD